MASLPGDRAYPSHRSHRLPIHPHPLPVAGLALLAGGATAARADPFDDAPTLVSCDDDRLLTVVRAAIAQNIRMTVRSTSNIRSVSRTATGGVCTLHAVATTGEEDNVTYTLTLHGGGTDFLITDVTQTRAPNGSAP